MSAVTNELMYELLKRIHGDLSDVKFDVQELKKRMTNTEEALAGINRRLDRHEDRLDRIERRLELRELAEKPQTSYEPPQS
jgi:predicted  nucleic acid-binding Zn-ribbon protein